MPQRPLRLTFGPSRSGLIYGQLVGGGFRGRISEAWPHFSAPGAFMLGGTDTLSGTPKKKRWNGTNTKKNTRNTIQKRIEQIQRDLKNRSKRTEIKEKYKKTRSLSALAD